MICDLSYLFKKQSTAVMLMVVVCIGLAACDFFEVENPQAISANELNSPDLIEEIANGAAATFADAYNQAILVSELAADAVIWVSSQTSLERIDKGVWRPTNTEIDAAYNLLSVARWTGAHAVSKLKEIVSNPAESKAIARSHFYTGFSLLLFGDYFSRFTIDGGPPLDDMEAYRMAIEHFSKAFTVAQASDAPKLAVAVLGARARAHHWLAIATGSPEEYAAALEDAQAALDLDPRFKFTIAYQQPARPNGWWDHMLNEIDLGIGKPFRRRIDPVSGEVDPRVPVSDFRGMSANGRDSVFVQLKYTTAGSDIALVKWQEMKLIIAEVQWRQDNLSKAVAAINAVRRAAGLPEFVSSDRSEILDQIIYERSAGFFLEGRRWPDARRFSTEFDRINILPDDRWSPEAQLKSVSRKWPIPITERQSNPNL